MRPGLLGPGRDQLAHSPNCVVGIDGCGAAGVLGAQVSLSRLLAGPAAKDTSLIYVFLKGGLSTIDTFDMKPDAPVEVRGDFKEISTNLPGVRVCEHLPRTADRIGDPCDNCPNRSNVSQADAEAILGGLDAVEAEIVNGTFPFRDQFEDIHMNVEARLSELIGFLMSVAGLLLLLSLMTMINGCFCRALRGHVFFSCTNVLVLIPA